MGFISSYDGGLVRGGGVRAVLPRVPGAPHAEDGVVPLRPLLLLRPVLPGVLQTRSRNDARPSHTVRAHRLRNHRDIRSPLPARGDRRRPRRAAVRGADRQPADRSGPVRDLGRRCPRAGVVLALPARPAPSEDPWPSTPVPPRVRRGPGPSVGLAPQSPDPLPTGCDPARGRSGGAHAIPRDCPPYGCGHVAFLRPALA